MAEPGHFKKVVAGVFTVNMIMKTLFGLIGFFAYGMAVDQVLTNNLNATPRLAVSVLIVANTVFSFPLPLIPVFRYLKKKTKKAKKKAKKTTKRTTKKTTTVQGGRGGVPSSEVLLLEGEEKEEDDEDKEEEKEEKEEEHTPLVQFFQRSAVVVVCGLVAAAIPNFALAMGFMGWVEEERDENVYLRCDVI